MGWQKKHRKREFASHPLLQAQDVANNYDVLNAAHIQVDSNGISKSKGLLAAANKGKTIMVDEEDEGKDDEDDNNDDSSDLCNDEEIGEDDDSDFIDDPLAKVDLDNVLPSLMISLNIRHMILMEHITIHRALILSHISKRV